MHQLLRHRPSPAMVVASLALLFALTGTGIAAVAALPRNSVGTAQLRKNAVTSSKVRNRSLLARDFKRGQLPRGPAGPAGDDPMILHRAVGDRRCGHTGDRHGGRVVCDGDCTTRAARITKL